MPFFSLWEAEFAPSAYRLTKEQVKEFLTKLNEFLTKIEACKTDHSHSIKILTEMGISEEDQEEFLGICDYYGGYCDCEIFWNALEHIEADFETYFFDDPENLEDEDLDDDL